MIEDDGSSNNIRISDVVDISVWKNEKKKTKKKKKKKEVTHKDVEQIQEHQHIKESINP